MKADADFIPNTSWWRRVIREAPGLAAIAAVVLLVFSPLVGMNTLLITLEGPTIVSDMVNASYPFRLLLGQALAKGHLPLWTDQIFCGYPLLADPAVGTFYPLNWLFAFLPGPAAMSLVILLTCMMAGWFTYYYCRALGLGRVAATLGGMSFAVCGFFASHAKHVALSSSACWLPLELALAEKAVRDRGRTGARAALWLAPVVALQFLAGGLQLVYISALAVAAYALVRLASRVPGELRWRLGRYALLGLAMAWGLALAAGQLLPARELSQVSERAAGLGPREAELFVMPARDLLTLVSAGAAGRATDYSYFRINPAPGLFWEDYIYVGWPVMVLAVLGLPWALRRWPQARILLVLGVAGVVFALGQRGMLFPIAFEALPGMKLFRFPQRFLLWTEMAAAVLGAMGADMVLARLRGRWRLAAAAALLAVTLVDLTAAQSKHNIYYSAKAWLTPPATVAAVRESQTAGLAPRVSTVRTTTETLYYDQLYSQGGWEAHLDELFAARSLLAPSSNAIWGVPAVSGYAELVPESAALVWRGQQALGLLDAWDGKMIEGFEAGGAFATPPPGYIELLGAANVQYIISRWPLQAERLQQIPLSDKHYLYRNLDALGRAYLVPGAENVGTDAHFLALQWLGQADFRRRVYLYGSESPAQGSFSAIPVRAHDNAALTRVTLEPDAAASCWLVLSDSYYPGWSVTIDGAPAQLERANGAMRAVQLPAGKHRVEFSYRCRPLEVGLAVAGVSGLLWLLALWVLPPRFPQGEPQPAPSDSPRADQTRQPAEKPARASRRRSR